MDVRAFMERFFTEAINKQDVSRLDEFCAPDYKWHGADNSEALGEAMGFDEYVSVCGSFFEAFPDFHVDIQEILVDGDRACVRYVEGGTHVKEFAGFPADRQALDLVRDRDLPSPRREDPRGVAAEQHGGEARSDAEPPDLIRRRSCRRRRPRSRR